MRNSTLIFLLFTAFFVFPQQQKKFFDDELSERLSVFNLRIDESIQLNDTERTTFLFDSLFTNHLKDTYVRPLIFDKIRGGSVNTDDFELPFVIITKSAWFIQDDDEVNMVNDFAKRYKNQINIVVIYWGDYKSSRKLAKNYNNHVITTFIDETQNTNPHATAIFKHAFGAPACYFVSEKKQLAFIDKVFSLTSANANINSLEDTTKQLALLIFKDETTDEGIFTTIEEPSKSSKDDTVDN